MCKLKADKKKEFKVGIAHIVIIKSVNTPNLYLLPLAGSFDFNFSFLILPDIISNNMPIPFL